MKQSNVLLAALFAAAHVCADLLGIPSVAFKRPSDLCQLYPLRSIKEIQVDSRYANSKDDRGSTLIPPTLLAFASTFSQDLESTLGFKLAVKQTIQPTTGAVFITVNEHEEFLDAAGKPSSEGYTLTTNASGIFIEGASPLGAWWATRSVLQQAILYKKKHHNAAIPYGHGKDVPGWSVRGMMLDAGRHFYPKEFLVEMCSYMSYFKQNTFHVHLSDNVNSNPKNSLNRTLELNSAWFRLWSENKSLEGLALLRNESYSRDEFDHVQQECASRGVTVLPEIEAPGHALRIVQWRPQIGFNSDLTLLNISHPDTIPTMQEIWKEFLPWFHSKTVSIGADEYHGPTVDYNRFVNVMNDFIYTESRKSMRIWGTFPPKYDGSYINIAQNVSIQHWAYYYDHAVKDYLNNNYSVVNSDRMYYVVNKWNGQYPPRVPIYKTFNGDPSITAGGPWYPNIFDVKNISENANKDNEFILGAVTPLWNDAGPNATTVLEAYYALRDGIPALADKQWGGKLKADGFQKAFDILHTTAPNQNLERIIPSKDNDIMSYSFTESNDDGSVADMSGNDYNAKTNCQVREAALQITPECSLITPWLSKGRNYTLEMELTLQKLDDPTNSTIIAGGDSVLMLTPNITLFTGGIYYRLNTTLPLNKPVKLQIHGSGEHTYSTVSHEDSTVSHDEFTTKIGVGEVYFRWERIGIEAPVHKVTGWTGELKSLRLVGSA